MFPFIPSNLVSASPRVYFQRRKSSFGFIASPLAAYRLLKCEFQGLLGDFLESSCQPNRKSPLRSSFRFLFPTFSARLSQQQASGLVFFHRSSLAVCPSGHALRILLWTCNHFLVTSSRLSAAFYFLTLKKNYT